MGKFRASFLKVDAEEVKLFNNFKWSKTVVPLSETDSGFFDRREKNFDEEALFRNLGELELDWKFWTSSFYAVDVNRAKAVVRRLIFRQKPCTYIHVCPQVVWLGYISDLLRTHFSIISTRQGPIKFLPPNIRWEKAHLEVPKPNPGSLALQATALTTWPDYCSSMTPRPLLLELVRLLLYSIKPVGPRLRIRLLHAC